MKRKGFTLIELLVVVAIIALLISILLPSLARARELAKRAVCRANMRGIGQSCYIYSNEYEGSFPVAKYKASSPGANGDCGVQCTGLMGGGGYEGGSGAPDVMVQIGGSSTGTAAAALAKVPVSRSLFLLVIGNNSTPKQFICPSSGDEGDSLRNVLAQDNEEACQPGVNRFDFWGLPNLSYGYQHPYNSAAEPNTDLDVRMALGADRGPWFIPDTNARTDKILEANPESPFSSLDSDDILAKSNDEWSSYNSGNHTGEGQSILYVDGHVEFLRKPIVGVNNDNIYTIQGENAQLEDILSGDVPGTASDLEIGPRSGTDSLILP